MFLTYLHRHRPANPFCAWVRNVLVSDDLPMPRVRLAEIVRELPRRAHDLSRRDVMESQRWRILEAVTEVIAKLGYADASVADVIAVAGISRKTFYEQFRDKEDCFLTAYDVLSARSVRSLVNVGAEVPSGPRRRRAQ